MGDVRRLGKLGEAAVGYYLMTTILDCVRTATNAFGDSVGSAVVDQAFPKDESAPAAA